MVGGRLRALTSLLICLLFGLSGCEAGPQDVAAKEVQMSVVAASEKHRGVSWVAGRDTIVSADMRHLADLGTNWIVQTPFGWQRAADGPEVLLARGERVWWGERDHGIRRTTEAARAHGIKTMLKPHIWLSDRDRDTWRGDIAMDSDEDWAEWFANYERFILHYAALAEELKIEALCIGTELHGTMQRESDWRSLIAKVRAVYSGPLTYAANWYEEYEEVPFWDELDWIGIQAYFPLSEEDHPDRRTLEAGWSRWIDEIERVQAAAERPVMFTEVGYRSVPGAAREPWVWPRRGESTRDERDFSLQADAYRALFSQLWERDWFKGLYVWKWYSGAALARRDYSADFTPQQKVAEDVIREAFRAARAGVAPVFDPTPDGGAVR